MWEENRAAAMFDGSTMKNNIILYSLSRLLPL